MDNAQYLVDYYWFAEQRRAECPEITLLEIAEEFIGMKKQ